MKNIFLLTLTSLIIQNSIYSNSFFPDSTANWTVLCASYCYNCNPTYSIEMFEVGNDTTISGNNYHEVLYNYGYFGAIRSDSNKVYFYKFNDTSEIILYDFSLNLNDTFYSSFYNKSYSVIGIDSINIGGSMRKRIFFNDSLNDEIGNYWIEGIGSCAGVLKPVIINDIFLCGCGLTQDRYLICFYENSSLIYKDSIYVDCEASNITNISNNYNLTMPLITNTNSEIKIHNLNRNEYEIRIWNMLGQLQYFKQIESENELFIEKNQFHKGVYVIVVKGLTNRLSEKIIIN